MSGPNHFAHSVPSRNGPSEGKRWDKGWDTFVSFGGSPGALRRRSRDAATTSSDSSSAGGWVTTAHSVAFGWPGDASMSQTVRLASSMQYQSRPPPVTSYCHCSISLPLTVRLPRTPFERMLPVGAVTGIGGETFPRDARVARSSGTDLLPALHGVARPVPQIPALLRGRRGDALTALRQTSALRSRDGLSCRRDAAPEPSRTLRIGVDLRCRTPLSDELAQRLVVIERCPREDELERTHPGTDVGRQLGGTRSRGRRQRERQRRPQDCELRGCEARDRSPRRCLHAALHGPRGSTGDRARLAFGAGHHPHRGRPSPPSACGAGPRTGARSASSRP